MHQSYFFEWNKSKLHYTESGSGNSVLLTFHGFGQDHKAFDPILRQLQNDFTIFSFDIYYHGKSHWLPSGKELTKVEWKEIIQSILEKHEIETFSLLCFSMGGKFALSLVETIPHSVDKIIFMAPDGIKTSFWYSLATYPLLFQGYFKSMIVKPIRFFGLLSFFKKLGLVEKGISKFAASQMNSAKKRRRVYYSWVVFKKLTFNMKQLAETIIQNNIEVVMILGKHDKIITEQGMDRLLNKLPHYKIEIIDSGHNDLIKKASQDVDLMSEF